MTESIEQFIERCIETDSNLKISNEQVRKIGDEIKNLYAANTDDMTGDQMSKIVTTLSILLVYLGSLCAKYRVRHNANYAYRKIQGAVYYVEIKDGTGAQKEKLAETKTQEYRLKEVEYSYTADSLHFLHKDVHGVVSALQSRMKVMAAEISKLH